jgi:hypothetical protein
MEARVESICSTLIERRPIPYRVETAFTVMKDPVNEIQEVVGVLARPRNYRRQLLLNVGSVGSDDLESQTSPFEKAVVRLRDREVSSSRVLRADVRFAMSW